MWSSKHVEKPLQVRGGVYAAIGIVWGLLTLKDPGVMMGKLTYT